MSTPEVAKIKKFIKTLEQKYKKQELYGTSFEMRADGWSRKKVCDEVLAFIEQEGL